MTITTPEASVTPTSAHTIATGTRNPASKAEDGSLVASTYDLTCACALIARGESWDEALDLFAEHKATGQ